MNVHSKIPSEDKEQEVLVSWFRMQYPNYLMFSVPNGGNRNAIEGAKLKKTGTLAGIPDLIILTDKKILFVEMKKRSGGRLSNVQKDIHSKLNQLGYEVIVGFGFSDARDKIEKAI